MRYACAFPERIEKLVLIGMGPLNEEMSRFYRANVRKMIPPEKWNQIDTNESSHAPWIDQPEAFYQMLNAFVNGTEYRH